MAPPPYKEHPSWIIAVGAGGACVGLTLLFVLLFCFCRERDSCLMRCLLGGGRGGGGNSDRHSQFVEIGEESSAAPLDRLNALIQAERRGGGGGGGRMSAEERRRAAASKRIEKERQRALKTTPQTCQTLEWLAQRNANEQVAAAQQLGAVSSGAYQPPTSPPTTSATSSQC